jgi:hypothetical protein
VAAETDGGVDHHRGRSLRSGFQQVENAVQHHRHMSAEGVGRACHPRPSCGRVERV